MSLPIRSLTPETEKGSPTSTSPPTESPERSHDLEERSHDLEDKPPAVKEPPEPQEVKSHDLEEKPPDIELKSHDLEPPEVTLDTQLKEPSPGDHSPRPGSPQLAPKLTVKGKIERVVF